MIKSLEEIAKSHYENFPVGSIFIPGKYRKPIHLIYTFARVADDIADEGTDTPDEKIRKLDEWEELLKSAVNGQRSNQFFEELAQSIQKFDLPINLFEDLLKAFRKDCENPIYETFSGVLEYCTYSANPIGRLLLKIFNCSTPETERLSDDICTALQLTNFWQDISIDTRRNRFYIAQEELEQYEFSLSEIHHPVIPRRWKEFMKYKVNWTKGLFESGKPLLWKVPFVFRFELKLIWLGGMRMLEKVEQLQYDTRFVRPSLNNKDKFIIFTQAMRM